MPCSRRSLAVESSDRAAGSCVAPGCVAGRARRSSSCPGTAAGPNCLRALLADRPAVRTDRVLDGGRRDRWPHAGRPRRAGSDADRAAALLGLVPGHGHFVEGISDQRAGRSLLRAIEGKGGFRRFKDRLHQNYPDLLPAWHAFQSVRAKRRAIEWLVDNSLVDQQAAAAVLARYADPDLP